jgi:hypothetical protein
MVGGVDLPRRIIIGRPGFALSSRGGSERTSVFFSVAASIHDTPGVSCRAKRRISAMPQPTRTAAGKTYRIAGMPMRNISILPMAKIAPAIPPPTRSLALLICGREVSSDMGHLLPQNYRTFGRLSDRAAFGKHCLTRRIWGCCGEECVVGVRGSLRSATENFQRCFEGTASASYPHLLSASSTSRRSLIAI